MDEFKQYECVICFEEYQKGVTIKKIPICNHLFHSKCINSWFKSKIEDAVHKCPLCNAEITIDKLKEAIKKRKDDRRNQRHKANNQANLVIPSLDESDTHTRHSFKVANRTNNSSIHNQTALNS